MCTDSWECWSLLGSSVRVIDHQSLLDAFYALSPQLKQIWPYLYFFLEEIQGWNISFLRKCNCVIVTHCPQSGDKEWLVYWGCCGAKRHSPYFVGGFSTLLCVSFHLEALKLQWTLDWQGFWFFMGRSSWKEVLTVATSSMEPFLKCDCVKKGGRCPVSLPVNFIMGCLS